MERSRDKVIAVRTAGSHRLMSSSESVESRWGSTDTIKQEYVDMEPVASIRVLYDEHILVHPLTIDSIAYRLRDEDIMVRLAILKNLKDHALIQQLPIKMRHSILHCLQDRNDVVVKATEALLIDNWWFKEWHFNSIITASCRGRWDCWWIVLECRLYLWIKSSHTLIHEKGFNLGISIDIANKFLSVLCSTLFLWTSAWIIHRSIDFRCSCVLWSYSRFVSSEDTDKIVFRNMIQCLQYLDVSDEICKNEILHLVRHILSNSRGSSYGLGDRIRPCTLVLLQALLNLLDGEASFLR